MTSAASTKITKPSTTGNTIVRIFSTESSDTGAADTSVVVARGVDSVTANQKCISTLQ